MPASSFANRAGQRNRSAGASSVKSGIKDDLRQQGESEQLSNPAHRTASEPRKTDYIPIYQEHCSSERGQGEDLHASNISSAGEFLPAEGTHSHPSPAGRTIRLNQYGHELDGQFDWAVDKSKRMIKELPRRSLAGHLGSPPSINRDAEDVPLGLVERRVHASRGSGETLGDLPNLIQDLRYEGKHYERKQCVPV
ncbi:hypothetical protein K437DRAFT_86830 [Tilletiaria anomala UBC 951]|uniref:Uncharacterized protein n=1 Tax=Tilletiaria anomala (strain ATCC 24038 / CBS 436.72 / UBC 951) TaxID=1037660 RepID=A0A066W431_TILAU|nr:uncharacterized protein K437DRAFT_86830 [Tilletiaria anomala UBC 951]KDN48481.1 hypothetical protein K437DRAFT_86830 [Tilletiaria anomala UBC 951]